MRRTGRGSSWGTGSDRDDTVTDILMSDRLVLRPASSPAQVACFARGFGWPMVDEIPRDRDEGVDGLTAWEAPAPLGSFFHCEDADFGIPYVAVSGTDRAAVDTVVAEARRVLDPWTLPELYAGADGAAEPRNAAETTVLIGLAAPNDFTPEVYDRISAAMRGGDENVRWAAVWATTYTGYDAFIPGLRRAAESDPVEWVRARALSVLGVFEDFRGEPPYTT